MLCFHFLVMKSEKIVKLCLQTSASIRHFGKQKSDFFFFFNFFKSNFMPLIDRTGEDRQEMGGRERGE